MSSNRKICTFQIVTVLNPRFEPPTNQDQCKTYTKQIYPVMDNRKKKKKNFREKIPIIDAINNIAMPYSQHGITSALR